MIDECSDATPGVTLTNARSRQVIARDVEVALTRVARRKGLLSRASLDPSSALVLAPCFAIHTAFMRFSIDVVFVDRAGCIRQIVRSLQPWRMAASPGAYATIEFAAGALDHFDLVVGDRLCLGMSMSMPLSAFGAQLAEISTTGVGA
jgi:uncharacterized membrane protein (UPF0127 family)